MARVSLHHGAKDIFDEPEMALSIDLERLAGELFVQVHERFSLNNTCVIYQDIDISKLVSRLLDDVCYLLSITNIQLGGHDGQVDSSLGFDHSLSFVYIFENEV
jgi:hypothetical protein